ncbi:hypothetical protein GCM10012320_04810 [Sinomonas cellulolyticus]|nr:hypothetical protein GCM10012320_04810 [Sinomonas sp. KCTC 49339]
MLQIRVVAREYCGADVHEDVESSELLHGRIWGCGHMELLIGEAVRGSDDSACALEHRSKPRGEFGVLPCDEYAATLESCRLSHDDNELQGPQPSG